MKKILLAASIILTITIPFGCQLAGNKNNSGNLGDSAKASTGNLGDTLKEYNEVKKMERDARDMGDNGYYDSAISHYDKCITLLNSTLKKKNNRGIKLYGGEIAQINSSMTVLYDSLHLPENSLKCEFEALKWSKLSSYSTIQVDCEVNIAAYLKDIGKTKKDTAEKGTLYRQSLQYILLANKDMDSLKTDSANDIRAFCYMIIAKSYKLLGYKTQAETYHKMYVDLYKSYYFKEYHKMPDNIPE